MDKGAPGWGGGYLGFLPGWVVHTKKEKKKLVTLSIKKKSVSHCPLSKQPIDAIWIIYVYIFIIYII